MLVNKKYTLTGSGEFIKDEDYYLFDISEKVMERESIGDFIGIDTTDNVLWLLNYNYSKDEVKEIKTFIEEYFHNPIDTFLYINRRGILDEN